MWCRNSYALSKFKCVMWSLDSNNCDCAYVEFLQDRLKNRGLRPHFSNDSAIIFRRLRRRGLIWKWFRDYLSRLGCCYYHSRPTLLQIDFETNDFGTRGESDDMLGKTAHISRFGAVNSSPCQTVSSPVHPLHISLHARFRTTSQVDWSSAGRWTGSYRYLWIREQWFENMQTYYIWRGLARHFDTAMYLLLVPSNTFDSWNHALRIPFRVDLFCIADILSHIRISCSIGFGRDV